MSKRIFTKEQIETLLQNQNVIGCSEKSIHYSTDFKVSAAQKYQEGMPSSEIFRQAGFNIAVIGRKTPKWRLGRWLKIFKQKGEKGLKTDGRGQSKSGGRPRSIAKVIADLPDKEKVKRLEAEVAYLKEENRFLDKLRKKRLNYGHVESIQSSGH